MNIYSRIFYVAIVLYAVYQQSFFTYVWVFLFLMVLVADDAIDAYRERTKKNAKAIRDSAPSITIYPPSDTLTPQ